MKDLVLFLCLLPQLGANDFRAREKANAIFAKDIDRAIMVLKYGESHRDQEIAWRCRRMVNLYFSTNADKLADAAKPAGWEEWPWIDLPKLELWEEPSVVWQLHLRYLVEACIVAFPKDNWSHDHDRNHNIHRAWNLTDQWSEATRLYVRDCIAHRQPYQTWLDAQCAAQVKWYKDLGFELPVRSK